MMRDGMYNRPSMSLKEDYHNYLMQDTDQHGKIKIFLQTSVPSHSLNFTSGKESKYLVSMDGFA
jgi:hypothetical protein